jgi:uncharacterized protein YoxC/protein involved in ribonucleotide reduction
MDDDKKIEAAGDAAEKAAAGLGGINKESKRLADAMNYLTNKHKFATDEFLRLHKSVESGRQKITTLGPALQELREQVEELTEKTEEEIAVKAKLRKDVSDEIAKFKKETIADAVKDSLAAGAKWYLNYQASTARSVLQSYQSNASAATAYSDAMIAQVGANAKGIHDVTNVIETVGSGLLVFGAGVGQVVGGLMVAGGKLTDWFVDAFKEYKEIEYKALANEVNQLTKTFQASSTAGALFANGMTEFRQNARDMLLSQEEYAAVITSNKSQLTAFGGSLSNGVKQFSNIGKEMLQYRVQLNNLGISSQDQSDMQASYMQLLGTVGQGQRRDYAELAKETRDYILNLKDLSSLTGEDVKTLKQKGEEFMKHGDVLAMTIEMIRQQGLNPKDQEKLAAKMQTVGQLGLPPDVVDAVRQLAAFGTVNKETAINNSADTLALAQQIAGMVRQQNVSSKDLQDYLKNYLTTNREQLSDALSRDILQATGPNATFGPGNLKGRYLNEQAMLNFVQRFSGSLGEMGPSAEDASNTTDQLTNSISKADVAVRSMYRSASIIFDKSIIKFSKDMSDLGSSAEDAAEFLAKIPGISLVDRDTVKVSSKELAKTLQESGISDKVVKYTDDLGNTQEIRTPASSAKKSAPAAPTASSPTSAASSPVSLASTTAPIGTTPPPPHRFWRSLFSGNKKPEETQPKEEAKVTPTPVNDQQAAAGKATHQMVRDLIQSAESLGYDSIYPSGKVPGLTNMSLLEAMRYQLNHNNGAIGRYQFIPSTLRRYIEKNPNTAWQDQKFDESFQDQLADMLIDDMGYAKYASGAMSKEDFLRNLASTWAGLPEDQSGRSHYEGLYGNHATISYDKAISKLADGGVIQAKPGGTQVIAAEAGQDEAYVPLKNGRIPVKLEMDELIAKMDEFITVAKAHKDISEKTLRATA